MKLSELIAKYGDEEVKFQNLDNDAISMNWSAKQGVTKVTFGTPEQAGLDGMKKLGLVVWMDRERVKEIIG